MRRLSFLILGLAVSLPSFAAITQSHGYAQFGTLKYPANFQHFDWTNPDAPKGGTLRLMASGSFDHAQPLHPERHQPDRHRRFPPVRRQ